MNRYARAAVCGIVIWSGMAMAGAPAEYPVKSIRLVVPFAPSGGTDMIARIIALRLTEAWGQPVVVDHRPGGSGALGGTLVKNSPKDGYTLLICTSSTHAISPNLYKNPPYDPSRDFAAVILAATAPNVLVAHASVPANSVKELIALAKAKPGSLNYASPGTGTVGHMAAELFRSVTGTDIVHVPYKGSGSAQADLLGGHVQLMFSGPGAVIQQVYAKKLKALAVATQKRAVGLEDVPTFIELGFPAMEASNWYGILTTAGAPRPVIDKLNREISRILALPDTKERFLTQGYEPTTNTPDEFQAKIRNDNAKWAKVVKASGIALE